MTLERALSGLRVIDFCWVGAGALVTKLLAEHGATMDQVVKGTLFLADLADFAACNEVWMAAFDSPRPTRSTFQVAALPLGARAEVELWAYSPLS